ncbi:MAG: recombinase family protein [Pseudomonadota bacterium]|nr:recombinase family protein [Pseudomonadota bacterium]
MSSINANNRCVLYVRKSSEQEDRQVLSLDSQVREMREYATRAGLIIAETLVEAASAKRPGRPVFEQLVGKISRGSVRAVLAWHPDRLSRNALDAARLVDLMDQGKLAEIHTPSQVFRATPTDKFFLTFHWGQAKLENDNKSVNVKRGLNEKARRGARPSPAPTGYLNDPLKPKGQKAVLLDPDRAPLVRRMFDLVLAGTPPAEVRRRANDEWGFRTRHGRPLSRSCFYLMLSRPFYAGEFEYPEGSGIWHKGSHPPILTLGEFDRIKKLLATEGRPRSGKRHEFAYAGLLSCGSCGAAVTAEEKHKRLRTGDIRRYVYYHCTKRKDPECTERGVEEAALEGEMQRVMKGLTVHADFAAWALACLEDLAAQEGSSDRIAQESLRRTIAAGEKRLDGLLDMRAAGEITPDLFARKSSTVERELARLREQHAKNEANPVSWLALAKGKLALAQDAVARFQTATPKAKAEMLRNLGSNRQLLAKRLEITLDPVVRMVTRLSRVATREAVGFEPPKRGSTQRRTDPFVGVGPSWFRRWDAVRTTVIELMMSPNRPKQP